jgi:hypothetical protein
MQCVDYEYPAFMSSAIGQSCTSIGNFYYLAKCTHTQAIAVVDTCSVYMTSRQTSEWSFGPLREELQLLPAPRG